MAKKEFTYRGKTLDEIKNLSLNEFMELLPSRQRRSLKKGFTEQQRILLKKIRNKEKDIETHCRNMIILPEMIGIIIKIYNGNSFNKILLEPEMVGHCLGEFALTRKKVAHSSPGIGATRSSASISVR